MTNPNIIKFDGTSGAGDTINMNVPLPSSLSGRRIIELEGIADSVWTDAAKNAGTDWNTELGILEGSKGELTLNPEIYANVFSDKLLKSKSMTKLFPASATLNKEELSNSVVNAKLNVVNTTKVKPKEKVTVKEAKIGQVQMLDNNANVAQARTALSGSKIDSQLSLEKAVEDTIKMSTVNLNNGIVKIPVNTWSGSCVLTDIDLNEPVKPTLFIIQVLGISSFLGDYGLGKTVKTFSLLPGEETTISMRTWRSSETTMSESSSIIDSYDESSSERFAETIQNETTDTATQSKSKNWHVEAEAKASWGFGSASVSGGGGGESTSSTEEFARSANEALSEHAADASSHRENSVTSSSEATVSTGEETVIERRIKNINVKRTLNFVFRELNQLYQSKIHLKDIKIGFSNGRSGSYQEVPLSGMAGLLNEVIKTTTDRTAIANRILSFIAVVFDYKDQPVTTVEKVIMDACGTKFKSITEAKPDAKCQWEAPPLDMTWYYRFKRDLTMYQKEETHVVDGVLLKQSDQVLRTDSVIIEALLGLNDALDQYSADLQVEAIKEKQLANSREKLAQDIIMSGDVNKAKLFEQLFVPKEITTTV